MGLIALVFSPCLNPRRELCGLAKASRLLDSGSWCAPGIYRITSCARKTVVGDALTYEMGSLCRSIATSLLTEYNCFYSFLNVWIMNASAYCLWLRWLLLKITALDSITRE